MSISNWILIGSAVLIVIGWFISGYVDQRNNIGLKRLELQIDIYKLIMDFNKLITNGKEEPNNEEKEKIILEAVNKLDEIEIMAKLYLPRNEMILVDRLDVKNGNVQETVNELLTIAKNNTRNKLKIK